MVDGWVGCVNLSILVIVFEKFALCKILKNIHVIGLHIVLCTDIKKQMRTTSVCHTVENVFKITNVRFILLCHSITSNH